MLTYLLAWVALVSGLMTLFSFAEEVTKSEVKSAVTKWLLNINVEGSFSNWPGQFAGIFDGVFGKRHISFRCFWRSCIASISSVVIVLLVVKGVRSDLGYRDLYPLAFLPFLIIILNFIPDYISLLETRLLIRWLSKKYSTFRIFISLVFDFLITTIIWAIWFFSLGTFYLCLYFKEPNMLFVSFFAGLFFRLLPFLFYNPYVAYKPEHIIVLALFYSTFFTSVWVWLYVFSGLVVKALNRIGIGLNIFKGMLDIEKRPIRSLGFLICILISTLFIIGIPFVKT